MMKSTGKQVVDFLKDRDTTFAFEDVEVGAFCLSEYWTDVVGKDDARKNYTDLWLKVGPAVVWSFLLGKNIEINPTDRVLPVERVEIKVTLHPSLANANLELKRIVKEYIYGT